MAKQTTERRRLKAHEDLVLQVIKRQAGTLSKAILEGVMNAIDAGAQDIAVTVEASRVVITDDGKGFESADSIKQVFEVFGQPHDLDENGISRDAKFGTFRIGRGQLFAFGKNCWRSNAFKMETDINGLGLDYDLTVMGENSPGCSIVVELYDCLDGRGVLSTVEEVVKFCQYVPQNLMVNGECVSKDPAKMRWDIETEDAYINKKQSSNTWRSEVGIQVYQQGVFVETIQASTYGIEGVIVIKKAVQVNFARNQVIRSCRHWKRIEKLLRDTGIEEVSKKKKLSKAEASSLLANFTCGLVGAAEFAEIACLPDTNGKMWSIRMIKRLLNSNSKSARIYLTGTGDLRVAFAEAGSREADRVMQKRQALVLDRQYLVCNLLPRRKKGATMEAEELQLMDILCGRKTFDGEVGFDWSCGKLVRVSLDSLIDCKEEHMLISKQDETRLEKDFLYQAGSILSSIHWEQYGEDRYRVPKRMLCMGISSSAQGWTDGKSYVAIDRKFLAGLNLGMERDWNKVALLLVHEMCHEGPDTGTHEHTPEFYENYHDLSMMASDCARRAFTTYRQSLMRRSGKLPKEVRNQLNLEAEAYVRANMLSNEEANHNDKGSRKDRA